MFSSFPPILFSKQLQLKSKKKGLSVIRHKNMGGRICYVDREVGVCFALLFTSQVQLCIYHVYSNKGRASK